jgi:hypothetical protein
VGVGYGPPVYWAPPTIYYDYGAPVVVEPLPGPYSYEEPPVVYGEPPLVYGEPPVIAAPPPESYAEVGPDEVLDALIAVGFSDLQPMARRGSLYRLNAVDPNGKLVALEISVITGEIERVSLLDGRDAATGRPAAPPPRAAAVSPAPSMRDRLAAPRSEPDPLVVY